MMVYEASMDTEAREPHKSLMGKLNFLFASKVI